VRTIGILGGMGPAATADFYARIVARHGALRDQDHPPCIMYSATQVPDRTAFLLEGGADPTAELVAAVGLLEAAGADFIAMPCNSAHAFLPQIREAVAVPVLDMISLSTAAVSRVVPQARRIGILATTGTVDSKLYEPPLRALGLEAVYPQKAEQAEVMTAIKAIKGGELPLAGASDPRLVAAAAHLNDREVDCIIMACTEVPLALMSAHSPVVAIDGNEVLADTSVALAVRRIEFEEISHAIC
jgi:aspartate racemase